VPQLQVVTQDLVFCFSNIAKDLQTPNASMIFGLSKTQINSFRIAAIYPFSYTQNLSFALLRNYQ
jgi:hypothetical protein